MPTPITVLASTVSDKGSVVVATTDYDTLRLTFTLSVLFPANFGSARAWFETSEDGSTWRHAGSTLDIRSVGSHRWSVGDLDAFCKIYWWTTPAIVPDVGFTPSPVATWAIAGDAL
jgi:hypothetical protein